jgi:hypothetical protein
MGEEEMRDAFWFDPVVKDVLQDSRHPSLSAHSTIHESAVGFAVEQINVGVEIR